MCYVKKDGDAATAIVNGTERQMFLAALKTNPNAHLFALISFSTGLRASDVLSLEWSDIKWNILSSTASWKVKEKKTGVRRDITVGGVVYDELLKRHKNANRYVFQSPKSEAPITRNAIHIAYKKAAKTAMLTDVYNASTHTGRKNYATQLWLQGMCMTTIQMMLGHSDEKTTVGYTSCSRFYALAEAKVMGDSFLTGELVENVNIEDVARELAKAELMA